MKQKRARTSSIKISRSYKNKTPREVIQKQLISKIKELKKEIERIDFMGYIGQRNPFSNEQLNEQINLGINQKINEVFEIEEDSQKV